MIMRYGKFPLAQVKDVLENVLPYTKSTPTTALPDKVLYVKIEGNGHEHFDVVNVKHNDYGDHVVFEISDKVAEKFRQEGRRALQSELRHLLNAERA